MRSISLQLEKWYPLIVSIFISGFAYHKCFFLNNYESLLTSSLTIISIFIGFVGTLAGIILSSNGKAIAFMKQIGKLALLMSYIWRSLEISFIFVFYCILLVIYPTLITTHTWISSVWAFIGSYSLLLIHRSITRSVSLLKSAAEDI